METYSYEGFTWLLAMVIIPVVLFLGNVALRSIKRLPQTGASDSLLLLGTFELAVAVDPGNIILLIPRDAAVLKALVNIHIALFLAAGLAWLWSLVSIEPKLQNEVEQNSAVGTERTMSARLFARWLSIWILLIAIIVTQVFVLRG